MAAAWKTTPFALALLLALFGLACGEASPAGPLPASQQPQESNTGPILPLAGKFDLVPITSLEELVARSDVIAVVTPVETLSEYWPAAGEGALVASRFRLTIDRVLKGDVAPGESIVAHTPGGTFAASFGATAPQQPVAGQPVERRQDFARPFYQAGRQELVFLERLEDPALGTFYFDLGPAARYLVDSGRLLPVDSRAPRDPAAFAPSDIRGQLVGKSLPAAESLLRPVIARRAPKPAS